MVSIMFRHGILMSSPLDAMNRHNIIWRARCDGTSMPQVSTDLCRASANNNGETSAMTTATEIADKIAGAHGVTKAKAKAIVDDVFKQITTAATGGSETSVLR